MEELISLLPIGSVVVLEEKGQELMIYGRKQLQQDSDAEWDYVACPYPHGNISKDYNIFFNHKSIHTVIFLGYENERELELRKILLEMK
jgi:hypothetical protein